MKFLLNMNVPPSLSEKFITQGHSCRHVGEIDMASASDTAIVEEARARGEVILTHDLDYSHLLALSGERFPSVIILRLTNTNPHHLLERIFDSLPKMEKALSKGAIVSVEDVALRIRELPIARGEIE